MAKAATNILINSISGRISNVVFYVRRRADGAFTQCVRVHVIPRNPDTEAQRSVRCAFGDAVRSWQAMSPDERHSYIRKARYLNMSGYNLYISNYLKRLIQSDNYSSIEELKSKFPSKTWNLELSTCNSLPRSLSDSPSVSASYMLLSGTKTHACLPETRPG